MKVGLHVHRWNEEIFEYCKNIGGAVHIILDHNPMMVNAVKKAQPKTILVARYYVGNQLLDDPIRRADEFTDQLLRAIDGCDYDAASGYNEWDGDLNYHRGSDAGLEVWKRYTDFEVRRSQRLHAEGLKSVVGGCSVGTPPEHWFSEFRPALEVGDFLHLHEYSAPRMWDHEGWHCLKYRHVYKYLREHNLPILGLIISESGIDGGVCGRPKEGWRKFGPPGIVRKARQYMEDWKWIDARWMEDLYVVGGCAYDCGSTPGMGWLSFNIDPEMLPLWTKHAQEQGITYWEPKEETVDDPIRVLVREDPGDPKSPILGVDTMEMVEYLKGVLGREMPPSWPLEALKAQAVAAHCYAVRARQQPRHAEKEADLCNTICCQAWLPQHYANTDRAVEETRGVLAYYDDQVIQAFYSGHCGGQTLSNEEVWGGAPLPYLKPVGCVAVGERWGRDQYGHRVGMCQWGAHDMAEEGATYVEILRHYYAFITITGIEEEDYKKLYKDLHNVVVAAVNTLEAGLKHKEV